MKKITIFVLVYSILFSGCFFIEPECIEGRGKIKTKVVNIKEAKKLNLYLDLKAEVILRQSNEPKVTITAQKNLLNFIKISQNNNSLNVETLHNCMRSDEAVVIIVELPEFNEINVNGLSNVRQDRELSSENLDINISGSGTVALNNLDIYKNLKIKINLNEVGDVKLNDVNVGKNLDINLMGNGNVDILNLTIKKNITNSIMGAGNINLDIKEGTNSNIKSFIEGSGDITISSRTTYKRNEIDIFGDGDFKTFELPAENVYVSVTGSGDAFVNAIDYLKVNISGEGSVYYIGNPEIESLIFGIGELINNN